MEVAPSTSGPELCVHISEDSGDHPSEVTGVNGRQRTQSEMSVDDDESSGLNKTDDEEKVANPHHYRKTTGFRVPKIDAHVLDDEKLILMPEEAIFLSFGVGCLAIQNAQGQAVDYRQCWRNLTCVDSSFPLQYAAYHYYRGKNWIPKNGDDYGASYGKWIVHYSQ